MIRLSPRHESNGASALTYLLRIIGLAVGGFMIVMGAIAATEVRPFGPRHVLFALAAFVVGAQFVWFGITGREGIRSHRSYTAVWIIGVLLVAIGIYSVFFDATARVLSKAVLAFMGLAGVWVIVQAALSRRLRPGGRNASQSIHGSPNSSVEGTREE